MTTLNEIKKILTLHRTDLQRKYRIKEIGIFGSYVNGTAKKYSDIDILVHLTEPIGLDFVTLA